MISTRSPLVSQVDIRFPQPGSDEPDKVTVTGLPETVDNAIDHLLNLEEEYVSSLYIRKRCSYSTHRSACTLTQLQQMLDPSVDIKLYRNGKETIS